LGFYKPANIQCKFIPPLGGIDGKMSASDPNSTIYVTDNPDTVRTKILKYAFSGGQVSIKEHREKGGNPDIDVSFQWLKIFFEPDDKKLQQLEEDYRNGDLLTGELKNYLIEKINDYLEHHRSEREKAKGKLEKYLISD
jgi:tryptophanyl-tRNA synthetase